MTPNDKSLKCIETNYMVLSGKRSDRIIRDFAFFDVQVYTYTNECASK